MDMTNFLRIHSGLPQEGPGSTASTLKALSYIKKMLPPCPAILDVGCGPGRQTMDLLKAAGGKIIAVDNHRPFLNEVKRRAGSSRNVKTVNASMDRMKFKAGSFNLIWSEGAVYIMGFEKGLKQWKRFLKPGGYLAVTDISWFRCDPPREAKQFWNENYPAIMNVKRHLALIKKAGYKLISHFHLPEKDWERYYKPIRQKIEFLSLKYPNDKALAAVIEAEKQEMDVYRKYSRYYGYEFYIMQAL